MIRSAILCLCFTTLLNPYSIPLAQALPLAGNVELLLGKKQFKYSGLDDQLAAGLDISAGLARIPIRLAAYVSGAWAKDFTDTDGDPFTDHRYETGAGFLGTFHVGPFHPYAGMGLGRTTRKFHLGPGVEQERRDEETDYLRWISWGGRWQFPSGLTIGVGARSSKARDNIYLGGTQYGMTLGWSLGP